MWQCSVIVHSIRNDCLMDLEIFEAFSSCLQAVGNYLTLSGVRNLQTPPMLGPTVNEYLKPTPSLHLNGQQSRVSFL